MQCVSSVVTHWQVCVVHSVTVYITHAIATTDQPQGTTHKQTQNHLYGDNRKMAAGFAYHI